MSRTNYEISYVGKRVIELSKSFSTDKEFLKKCGISNSSFLSDLKNGRMKSPGAEYLEKIVRCTGASGTWLLTGEGEMFEPRHNPELGMVAEPEISYGFSLLSYLEEQAGALADAQLPPDVELQLARLLVKVLERKKSGV